MIPLYRFPLPLNPNTVTGGLKVGWMLNVTGLRFPRDMNRGDHDQLHLRLRHLCSSNRPLFGRIYPSRSLPDEICVSVPSLPIASLLLPLTRPLHARLRFTTTPENVSTMSTPRKIKVGRKPDKSHGKTSVGGGFNSFPEPLAHFHALFL